MTGVRAVVTKARSSMAVVTLEDLQGSVEVVVFPRLYEQTASTWQDGAIVLVAGRIDHRGEEVSLLADLVRDFDTAAASGEGAFAAEVAAGERGRGRGRPTGNGNGGPLGGNGNGSGHGTAGGPRRSAPADSAGLAPSVSPLREVELASRSDPGGPPARRPTGARSRSPAPQSRPISWPWRRTARSRRSPTRRGRPRSWPRRRRLSRARPDQAGACTSASPRGSQPTTCRRRWLEVRDVLRRRPGATPVTIHLPQGAGKPALPMELRVGVAYDAELVAEVGRRLRPGVVELELVGDREPAAT